MAKKKVEETAVAVLDSPSLHNSININMNQDDLIQLVIEDKITQLEAQLQN